MADPADSRKDRSQPPIGSPHRKVDGKQYRESGALGTPAATLCKTLEAGVAEVGDRASKRNWDSITKVGGKESGIIPNQEDTNIDVVMRAGPTPEIKGVMNTPEKCYRDILVSERIEIRSDDVSTFLGMIANPRMRK